MSLQIEFEVMCKTNFGEVAVICGNLPQLGTWKPEKALKLKTDEINYPYWTTDDPLFIDPGTTVEFKLCLLNSKGQVSRWQNIKPNRSFSPKTSLSIQFQDSQGPMMMQVIRRRQYSETVLQVQNIRKGTEQIINDLDSDSSSNREMWKQHKFLQDEQGSWILNQFVWSLGKAVSTQKECLFLDEPDLEDIKNYCSEDSPEYLHFFITHRPYHSNQYNSFLFVDPNSITLDEVLPSERPIFHVLQDAQSVLKSLVQKRRGWQSYFRRQMGCLTILYIRQQCELSVCLQGVDMVVCEQFVHFQYLCQSFVSGGYRLISSLKNQILVIENQRFKLKIILELNLRQFLYSNPKQYLIHFTNSICNFYFQLSKQQLRHKFSNQLNVLRNNIFHCLIVVQLEKIKEISQKTLGDLFQLSSKHQTVVVILIQEPIPNNLKDILPYHHNNLIIISTHAQIFYQSHQPIDLFKYVQINKNKFEENLQIITQKVQSLLIRPANNITYKGTTLAIKSKTLAEPLKQHILKQVKAINKKSIAKISINLNGNIISLTPFVLHPNFLLQVALSAFCSRIKNNQWGFILSVEANLSSNAKWMEPIEGRQLALDFCRVHLKKPKERSHFGCRPVGEAALQQILDLISELTQEKTSDETEE